MPRSSSHPGSCRRARAMPRSAWPAALALWALAACGIDDRASLGALAPPPPAFPVGTGAGAGAGAAPTDTAGAAAEPPAGGEPAPPPLQPVDAGGPPSQPEPPDAGPPPSACSAPRAYVGDFDCTLVEPMPFGPPPPPNDMFMPTMTTSIGFALEPGEGGTTAQIAQGSTFMFLAWELAFMGRLEGQLDCTTGRFDARIVDGMTGAVFGMPQTFVGALDGRLDEDTGRLEGTWWHGPSQDPMNGCMGTWSATPR